MAKKKIAGRKKIVGRKIIVFADGTGQDGFAKGEYPSNVCQLYQVVQNQVAMNPNLLPFYDPGVGTRRGGYKFGNWCGKFLGYAFGTGIEKNIQQCYEFICSHYRPGDKIFLFGFSRGAATVRSLSGLMDLFGVIPNNGGLIKEAFDIYKIKNLKRQSKKVKNFLRKIKNKNKKVKIKFLGVWDTVAMLSPCKKIWHWICGKSGVNYHEFHNLALSPLVENACHALSIDETRLLFDPIPWDKPPVAGQTMYQVWFSGVHSDIGGGYQDKSLSNITLDWMITNAGIHGLKFPRPKALNPSGFMHNERSPRPNHKKELGRYAFLRGKLSPKFVYHIHQSVFDRQKRSGGNYNPWIFLRGVNTAENPVPYTPPINIVY